MMSRNGSEALASIVYPQLLGLSMGIDEDTLGIHMNQIDITEITSFLNQE
jgi:heterodisulfide reductase subunit B